MKEINIKFYSVDEKLPEESGYYLVLTGNRNSTLRNVVIIPYSTKHKMFDTCDDLISLWNCINVRYWAEIDNIKTIFKGEKNENKQKNSLLATKQRQGIKNIYIIKILAFLRENYKYIFFTVMVSIFAIWVGETVGKIIAYLIWR